MCENEVKQSMKLNKEKEVDRHIKNNRPFQASKFILVLLTVFAGCGKTDDFDDPDKIQIARDWLNKTKHYSSIPKMLADIEFDSNDGKAGVLNTWELANYIAKEWHKSSACYEIRCAAYSALEVEETLKEVPISWMYIFANDEDKASLVVINNSKGIYQVGEIKDGFSFLGRSSIPINSFSVEMSGCREILLGISDPQGSKTIIVDFEIAGISKPNSPYPSSNNDNFILRQVGNIAKFINEKKLCTGLLISDLFVIAEQSWTIGQTVYQRRMLLRDAHSGEILEDSYNSQITQFLWNSGVGLDVGRDRPQAESSWVLICQGDVIRSFNADLLTSEEKRKYDTEINQKIMSGDIEIVMTQQILKKGSNIWNEMK